jgi:hypothetical protein
MEDEPATEDAAWPVRFGQIFAREVLLVAVATPAAASAPAATISAIAATTASATAGALGFGPGLIDVDRASAHLRAIQGGNCLLAVFVAGHLHEAEPTRAPGVTVGHDTDSVYLSERFKKRPEFVFVCVEAQIPNKDILHASASALSCRKCKQFGGLGRSGGPFLKIETAAGEQSNAPSSIAGFPKPARQMILK